jgi:hypothetical protein
LTDKEWCCIDLAPTFDDVLRMARQAEDVGAAWEGLVAYLEDRSGEPLPHLAGVDVKRDVEGVRRQLLKLVRTEPPPKDLNAVYFGLFDTVSDDGERGIGYYVAGVRGFDPNDGDSLCNPAWWPDGRYLRSQALNAVKHEEVSAGVRGQTDLRALLGYAGQLGAALLVSKFASSGLFPGHHYVVGFDSGDFAEIAA